MDFGNDMTIEAAMRFGKERLSAVMAVPDAVREAGYLLSAVLGEDKAVLLAFEDRHLSASEAQQFSEGLQSRAEGKPLALIRGMQEFYGRDFVCRATLIPRPDSESIVELALKLLPSGEALRILDIGCGSGCLGISVAVNAERQSHLTLSDADENALQCAEQNAKRHLSDGYDICLSNWFAKLQGSFDVILCNPPYIASDDLPYLPRGVRKFEPPQALNGGTSGLQAYEVLGEGVVGKLNPFGVLVLEIGSGQGEAVQELFTAAGLEFLADGYDLGGVRRALAFRRRP